MKVNKQKNVKELSQILLKDLYAKVEKEAKKCKKKICTACGEVYDFSDPDFIEYLSEMDITEDDLTCGECGGTYFVTKSKDPMIGFRSAEHYSIFMQLLPSRLRNEPNTVKEYLERIHYIQTAAFFVE